jgi:DUF177 domain-containing protein
MFIKIKDLELRKIEFAETLAPGVVELSEDIEQKGDLRASGRAELVEETRDAGQVVRDIRVVGSYTVEVKTRCARCLEPVSNSLAESFDLLYRPQGIDATGEDASIGPSETEIGYYQGEGLQLQEVLKEQILLALPAKQICSPDCKGLCPHCGRNLNLESCHCSVTIADPRWGALEEIRKKLEH